ncbi:MAG: response regulator transcription factor [Chloroflexota bacterium]|nr:MAG: response regulator transcription factor [Chloroflexota bacterium]
MADAPNRPHKHIRVLVVDDQTIVRRGTIALLTEVEEIQVVGEAEDGQVAIEQADALCPDVVIMDLVMPRVDGIEAIRQIHTAHPEIHILALTSFATDDKVLPAIRAGALGYFLKDANPEGLIEAIHQVAQGLPVLSPEITRRVLHEFTVPANGATETEPLTEREREVLRLVAAGMSNAQIAARLNIAEITVRTHVSRILDKLHLENRVQAALYALREGIATL